MPKANTKNILLRDREEYTAEGLKHWKTESLRDEYSRLRQTANNRLKNFQGTEWVDSTVYKENFGKFKELKGIKSDAELRKLTQQVADFVSAQTSTVTGLKHQRTAAIKTLHERGYGFVNKKNFKDFTNYMEDMRARSKGKQYDSERVAEVWHQMGSRRKMSNKEIIKDFDFYKDNLDTLSKMPVHRNAQPVSSADIKQLLKGK